MGRVTAGSPSHLHYPGPSLTTAVPRSLTQWNGRRRRAGCANARCAGGRLARAPGEAGERARAGAPGRSAWRRGAAAGRGVAMGACWPSQPSVCPPSRRPPRAVRGTGLPLGPVHPGRLSRRPPASHSFSRSPLGPFAPPVPSQRASAPAPSRPRPRPAQSACPRPSGAFAAWRARAPFPGAGVPPASCLAPADFGRKGAVLGHRHGGTPRWRLPTADSLVRHLASCLVIFTTYRYLSFTVCLFMAGLPH